MKNIHLLSCCKSLEECYCCKYSKKETIEEAAERLYPNDGQFEEFYGNINEFSQKVFLQGAEWQQERMYSEEEVEAKPLLSNNGRALFGYKTIIPKEEQCTCKEHDPYCCQIHGSCPTCVKKEEPKQETLEEAAEKCRQFYLQNNMTINQIFEAGAKWQQETMYSEEEIVKIIEDLLISVVKKEKNLFDIFKKFKKEIR